MERVPCEIETVQHTQSSSPPPAADSVAVTSAAIDERLRCAVFISVRAAAARGRVRGGALARRPPSRIDLPKTDMARLCAGLD